MENKCVRCEMLERKQKSSHIQYIGMVPLCDTCLEEIAEEELFFKIREEELEDESGSEEFD
jgi:hypothetical protein